MTDFDPLKLLEELQMSQLVLLENQQLLENQVKESYKLMERLNNMVLLLNKRLDLVIEAQKYNAK